MFDDETKNEVIRKYLNEGQKLQKLAREYGVNDVTISKWVKDYIDEYQTLEERDLYQGLSEVQLRYNLIKKNREKKENEKYIIISHYDVISMLDSIIRDQQSNQFSNCDLRINDRNMIDVYYTYEREKNRFINIYIYTNLPMPSDLIIDSLSNFSDKKSKIIEIFNSCKHPFLDMFDKDVVSLIYNLLDEKSIKKGYVDFKFQAEIVNRLIPCDMSNLRYNKSEKIRKMYRRKVLTSIYSLMNITFIECLMSEYGAISFPKNRNIRSKFLFEEIEWINEDEDKMRIYLSRTLCEDWLLENYKNKIYNNFR